MGDVLGCDLYINGELFQDGRVGDDFLSPLALDGLRITWGRETTVDQPEPSSCTFEVMDVPGGSAFLSQVYTGASVEVRSTVEVDPGGGGDEGRYATLPDPGFTTTAPGSTPSNVQGESAYATTARVVDDAGDHRLDLAKVAGTDANPSLVRTYLAPGPITSGDPDVWADLPRVGDGSTWSYALDALIPAAGSMNVQAVYIYAPDLVGTGSAGSGTAINEPATNPGPTGQGWANYGKDRFTLTPPQPAWLGLQVSFSFARWDAWPDTAYGATWDELPEAMTWDDLARARVDNANLYLYSDDPPMNDLVLFAGAITDLEVEWDESLPPLGGARLKVTAADFTAQTNNFYIGDNPWSVEPMRTRFSRVVTRLNQEIPGGWGFGYVVAPTLGTIPLGYQDVDNQAAYGLLQGFAESVDGVLWPAVHLTYPRRYFYVEDINERTSGVLLALDPETGYVEVDDTGANGRTQLSACYVLRDPVTFKQSSEDVTTRVAVQWEEQTTDDEGQPAPTQRTVELVDAGAEARLGVRRVQTSTLLSTETDATEHADRKLQRLSSDAWRAEGVVWDLAIYEVGEGQPWPADVQATAADLLDGTTRIGLPLTLTDLPEWSPSNGTLPLYVEGGTYEFTGGRWVLSLVVSNVYGSGASAAWDDLPDTWRWDDFGPDVTWNDIYGAQVEGGAAAATNQIWRTTWQA